MKGIAQVGVKVSAEERARRQAIVNEMVREGLTCREVRQRFGIGSSEAARMVTIARRAERRDS